MRVFCAARMDVTTFTLLLLDGYLHFYLSIVRIYLNLKHLSTKLSFSFNLSRCSK